MALASFLASFGAGLLGYFSNSVALTMTGIICGALSAGIYTFCEAKVDAASVASSITTTTKNVTATTDNSTIVKNALTEK